jgi:hypothetical protein
MSYTSEDQVKLYLQSSQAVSESILDQPVTLVDNVDTVFFDGSVEPDSVIVKSVQRQPVVRRSLELVSETVSLGVEQVARDSFLAAADSSLSEIYEEGADFTVDRASGIFRIKPGGALSVGNTVTVWYRACRLYEEGIDYTVDASRSSLRRTTSGDIGSGEQVLVDYSPVWLNPPEALVRRVVNDANSLVTQQVDPEGKFGNDLTLSAAATWLAVSLICRMSAIRSLAGGQRAEQASRGWLQIADDYQRLSKELLISFQPPKPGMSQPVRI